MRGAPPGTPTHSAPHGLGISPSALCERACCDCLRTHSSTPHAACSAPGLLSACVSRHRLHPRPPLALVPRHVPAGLWRLAKVFALGLPAGGAGGGVYTLQQPDQYPLVPAGPLWRAARRAVLGLRGPARD
jgi:hypothetical protein